MTDLRQTAQQALEALERYQVKRQDFDRFADVIAALRTALAIHQVSEFAQAQEQAEPVACVACEGRPKGDNIPCAICGATPPQRQWVGLTDEDVNRESAPIAQQMKLAFHAGMYVAQQILKERNNG